MILLLEGVDASGKSSIAQAIEVKYPYLTNIVEPDTTRHILSFKNEKEKYACFVSGQIHNTLTMFKYFDNFIQTRFHLSDFVYSNFYNRKAYISFNYLDTFLFLVSKEVKLILCDIDYDTYVFRHSKRKENDYLEEGEFLQQTLLFKQAFEASRLQKKIIDSSGSIENSLKQIEELL